MIDCAFGFRFVVLNFPRHGVRNATEDRWHPVDATGITCLLCPLKGNDPDPVDSKLGLVLEASEVTAFCWWKSPPRNGKTVGSYCYYCGRIWYPHVDLIIQVRFYDAIASVLLYHMLICVELTS